MAASVSSFGCYGFAGLCTMTVSGKKQPPTPSSNNSSSRPKPPQRRRRTRVPRVSVSTSPPSELARKYRTSEIGSEENDELIGGPSTKSSSSSSSASNGANSNGIADAHPVRRTSRFPATWAQAVEQLALAVEAAARDGHERIRVDLKNPELISPQHAASVSDKVPYTGYGASRGGSTGSSTSISISASSVMISPEIRRAQALHRMKLLMHATNALLNTLLAKRDELPGLGGMTNRSRGPPKASLFFNSRADRELGADLLDIRDNGNSNRKSVEVYTLGEGDEPAASRNDITVLLCPGNTQGNPSHIEHVELVHYSNWKNHNLVVAINPALMALTRHGSLDDEPRQPSFLSDYILSYYIDPVAYIAKNATGALLRCFPRKWEMYLLKFQHRINEKKNGNSTTTVHIQQRGFRLIGEANSRPSREKLLCEFSWRVNNSDINH